MASSLRLRFPDHSLSPPIEGPIVYGRGSPSCIESIFASRRSYALKPVEGQPHHLSLENVGANDVVIQDGAGRMVALLEVGS
jgi:hypothetical protein